MMSSNILRVQAYFRHYSSPTDRLLLRVINIFEDVFLGRVFQVYILSTCIYSGTRVAQTADELYIHLPYDLHNYIFLISSLHMLRDWPLIVIIFLSLLLVTVRSAINIKTYTRNTSPIRSAEVKS